MRNKVLLIILIFFIQGCSFIEVRKTYYRKDYGRKPQEKELSFTSKRALATGATLNNMTAAKVYYQGTEPQSKEAKILYDMSYRFMSLAGVKADFDPSDPESVAKIFEEADRALEEKERIIHQLKEDVKRYLQEKEKIVRDKEAELQALNNKWQVKLGNLWFWIWVIIIGFIALIIFCPAIGIPLLSRTVGLTLKAGKNTMKAIEAIRDKWKEEERLAKERGDMKRYEQIRKVREELESELHKAQSEEEKLHIKKLKAKGVIKNDS